MKVIVIGAGIVGLTTAWSLSKEGHDVVVLDKGPIPNPLSASFDRHRMIRFHYGEQAGYARMVRQAYRAWDELWTDLGTKHLVDTGVLAITTELDGWVAKSRETLVRAGLPHQVLEASDLERSYSQLAVSPDAWGLLTECGGVLLADRIIEDLAGFLIDQGVELRSATEVVEVDAGRARVKFAEGGEEEGDRLVIAAGAWLGALIPRYGSRITPIRSLVSYVEPPIDLVPAWADSPALFMVSGNIQRYALPPVAGTPLKFGGAPLKFGGAPVLKAGDPDAPRGAAPEESAAILASFAPFLKDPPGYGLIETRACFYADHPAKRFLIERIGRAFVVTACGGRMFKFGALIGRELAKALSEDASGASMAALANWAAGHLAAGQGFVEVRTKRRL